MNDNVTGHCPLHNVEMQEKEGQYGPYWTHMVPNVGWCNGKKIKPFTQPQQQTFVSAPAKNGNGETKTDWEAISRGKVRHGVAVAFIQSAGLQPLTDEIKATMKQYVEWIMNE